MRGSDRGREAIFGATVLVVCGLLAGLLGVVIGSIGLVAARFWGHRAPAAAALAALVYAALATVIEAPPSRPVYVFYAAVRPSAATAAKIAGVLATVAVAVAARDERDAPAEHSSPKHEVLDD